MRPGIFVLTIVLVFASSASADWEYTRWGSAVEDARLASKGQLQPCDQTCVKYSSDKTVARLFGPYNSGEFNFTAYAKFDAATDGLASVTLVLDDTRQASRLMQELNRRYGKPIGGPGTGNILQIHHWRDATNDISVLVTGGFRPRPSSLSISYQPKPADARKGRR